MKKIAFSLIFLFAAINFSYAQSNNCIYCGANELFKTSSAIGENNINSGELSLTVGRNNKIITKTQLVTLIGENNILDNLQKGSYSIGLGSNNTIKTDYSYIFGKDNIVSGIYGVAIGLGNEVSGIASVALGSWCKTYRTYGIAIGMGSEADSMATAIGFHALSLNTRSFTFGNFVKSSGEHSMTLGTGAYNSTYLENSIDNSLMIGFNSDVPTLFVSSSSGETTTGRIGIGNITAPLAKLHIRADNDENASIFLQPTGTAFYGELMFGDVDHYIKAKTGQDMTFATEPSKNFMFENGDINQTSGYHVATSNIKAPDANGLSLTNQSGNGIFVDNAGNVGIGTTEAPAYKLDVNGDLRFSGQLYKGTQLFESSQWATAQNDIYFNGGNVGIGTDSPTKMLHVHGDSYFNGNTQFDGQVGIGTSDLYDFQLTVIGKTQINQLEVQTDISIGPGIKMYSDGNLWVQTEVVVESTNPWPDFVFSDNYQQMSIPKLDSFIKLNKHLPEVPTEQDIDENGIGLGAISNILLKKIEELTLYVIEQQKEIEFLKSQISK